ncbi:hypothetical protein LCGC14_2760460 [marine sediment metagenome]|uniref:Uncharacterized protein n=1 Tax=marine sediment metagenome TaxID=412755 RepID=A0A0F8YZ75_9ZZZZ
MLHHLDYTMSANNQQFGEPDAHDATAQHEKTVMEAGEYAASLDESVKDDISNRPLGSVKISPQDERTEWELIKGNPENLAQFFVDQKMTVEQMIQYAKKMS